MPVLLAAAFSLPLLATNPPLPVVYDVDLDMTLSNGAVITNDPSPVFGAVHNATGKANVLIVGTDALVTGLTVKFDVDILNAAATAIIGTRHFHAVFDLAGGVGIVTPNLTIGGSQFTVTPAATVYMRGGKAVRTLPGGTSYIYTGPPTQPGGSPSMLQLNSLEFVFTTSDFGTPVTLDVQLGT